MGSPIVDNLIILRASPFDDLRVANVDFSGVETESVGPLGGGSLEPERGDRFPVDFNDGYVFFGYLGVEVGDVVVEDVVD